MTRSVVRTNRKKDPGAEAACLSATLAKLGATIHPHDTGETLDHGPGSTPGGPDALPRPTGVGMGWVRSTVRLLMMRGLTAHEAGNLVAYLAGLHAVESGWTIRQIEGLLLIRSLVACGQLRS